MINYIIYNFIYNIHTTSYIYILYCVYLKFLVSYILYIYCIWYLISYYIYNIRYYLIIYQKVFYCISNDICIDPLSVQQLNPVLPQPISRRTYTITSQRGQVGAEGANPKNLDLRHLRLHCDEDQWHVWERLRPLGAGMGRWKKMRILLGYIDFRNNDGRLHMCSLILWVYSEWECFNTSVWCSSIRCASTEFVVQFFFQL